MPGSTTRHAAHHQRKRPPHRLHLHRLARWRLHRGDVPWRAVLRRSIRAVHCTGYHRPGAGQPAGGLHCLSLSTAPHTLTLAFPRNAPGPSCLPAPPGPAAPCRCLGVRVPIPADRALTASFDQLAKKEYHTPAP